MESISAGAVVSNSSSDENDDDGGGRVPSMASPTTFAFFRYSACNLLNKVRGKKHFKHGLI